MISMEFELQQLQDQAIKDMRSLGFSQNQDFDLTQNSVDNLFVMINILVSQVKQLSNFKEIVQNNQIQTLNTYNTFIQLAQATSQFSKIIYSQSYQFPLQTFQCFRKTYQLIQQLSNSLNSYQSDNESFLQRKDEMISQQIRLFQQIKYIQRDSQIDQPIRINRKNSTKTDDLSYHQNQADIIQNERYIDRLNQEIEHLNHILRKNDKQYSLEIHKYNEALHQMGQQLRGYEKQFSKQKQFQKIIQNLQVKLVRFKEEKYRNQIIIDNMAKKIRIYEKQKNGNMAFLSPNRSNTNRNYVSPNSKMIQNSKSVISLNSNRNQNVSSAVFLQPSNKY